jgi:hypothetical protein
MVPIPKNIAAGETALASPLESAQAVLDTVATIRAGIPSFAFQISPGGRRSVTCPMCRLSSWNRATRR